MLGSALPIRGINPVQIYGESQAKGEVVRFIELATDGGCSQKANASELSGLLKATAKRSDDANFKELHETFPDVGVYQLDGLTTLSTVDVLFPMVDDAEVFGRIVANHVLNDIYASFGLPKFALTLLGAPKGLAADDVMIVKMLSAAILALKEAAISVVGGHSLAHQESLFLGFTVIGTLGKNAVFDDAPTSVGDSILMTKRLGTSVASLRWRLDDVPLGAHQDVVDGMLQSAALASQIAARNGVVHCTDISGFGFVNNLGMLLFRTGLGADIEASAIPIYKSVKSYMGSTAACTRQFFHNMDFSMARNIDLDGLEKANEVAWMDSQTSGGLLFICPKKAEHKVMAELGSAGIEVTKIGVTRSDSKIHFHS